MASHVTAALLDLAQVVGPGAVRQGTEADAVDGVVPGVVAEPPTAEGVAALLAWCSRERRTVVTSGGGTKLTWGATPDRVDVRLSMRALHRVTRYEPGDLTVTVEAGCPIVDLNRDLARHRQWLPIDGRGPASTVGGIVASNESGPLRHRYGAPRDVLIGVRVATADGRLASAGGQVVKNVAGYDLGRLMAGSFGSLAVIVSAGFKLSPVPAVCSTTILRFADASAIAGAAADIAASQLDPLACEVEALFGAGAASLRLLVRCAGMAEPVEAQADAVSRLAAAWMPTSTDRVSGNDDAKVWAEAASATWVEAASVLRLSWLPADLAKVLSLCEELVRRTRADVRLEGRAALGAGTLTLHGDPAAVLEAVTRLRASTGAVGNVVIVKAPAEVKRAVDVWGVSEGTALMSRLLKTAMDPAGVLNAGRGPL